jgi:hypothetical protein
MYLGYELCVVFMNERDTKKRGFFFNKKERNKKNQLSFDVFVNVKEIYKKK